MMNLQILIFSFIFMLR